MKINSLGKLGKDDYKDIALVREESVNATHNFLKEEEDFEFIKNILLDILPTIKIFGIKKNETLFGFMGVSKSELEMLFVSPKYVGKGLGKRLILYAVKNLNLKKFQ